MKSVVSEKGQVTIPKSVRDRLGLKPGTVLDFEAQSGKLIGKRRSPRMFLPSGKVGDAFRPGGTVDDYLKRTRDAHRD